MIDVANGTNVDVRLGSLKDGICAVEIEHARGVLLLQGGLKRVHSGRVEALARGAQERRHRAEGGRHGENDGIYKDGRK